MYKSIYKDFSSLEKNNDFVMIDENLKNHGINIVMKRIFDLFFSSLGLVLLIPLFIAISIIIKIDSKGPVLFKQVRVGKDFKEFNIYKFRTMAVDSEKEGIPLTIFGDSRITKAGRFLRRFKLDELPQIINVLSGEMSFVGPRPEVPKYVMLYDDDQKNILKVKPGITDLASIEYKDEGELLAHSSDPEKTYIEEIMPAKFHYNMIYIKNISVIHDIKLILKTIKKIVFNSVNGRY